MRLLHARSLNSALAAAVTAMVCASPAVTAAELPARAGAPAPSYLQVCDVGGMVGLLLPSSNLCLKISGYVSSQVTLGSLSPQSGLFFTGAPGASPVSSATLTPVAQRDAFGFATHAQIDLDAREMTAYGPLRAYVELLGTSGSGFDAPPNGFILNLGYVQFAGLTAGRAGSYFSYLAGGATWYDFYSPDRVNGNQPNLFAYTATFGSGFSATLSLEDPTGASVNNGLNGGYANAYYGMRYPDVVAALKYEQSWGSAQLSAVVHETHAVGVSNDTIDHWGGAALLGASVNLPSFGAGDRAGAQAVVSSAALGYSGIPNTAQSPWDQGLNANGNGTIFQLTDALNYAPGAWSYPTAWTAAAYYEHHFTPQFSLTPEISFANVRYSGSPAMISASATSVLAGAIAHWSPAPHLDVQLQMMVQDTHQATPASYLAPPAFAGHSNGVVGAMEIVRDF